MSKFNQSTKGEDKVVNKEGATAYNMTAELELYALVVTSLLSDKYYESDDERLLRMRELIGKVKPEFVAKLAVYARNEMYLRTVPLALVYELSKIHSGDDLVRKMTKGVVSRADEIAEMLACYQHMKGVTDTKKLSGVSKQLLAGLGDAFNSFDEYQFGKYNQDKEVKLRDALFLVHPKAKNDEQQKLFDKIVKDEMEIPYTWETQLSEVGQKEYKDDEEKEKAFTKVWEELIDSDKLGYMALMRNLRNMLDAKVSAKHIQAVADRLGDAEQVAQSRQFPFRFMSAYRQIKDNASGHASIILDALETAMVASAQNIKGFDIDTSVVIACDVSASMQSSISPRSSVEQYDIGLTLGMLLQNRCKNVVTGMFGDDWKIINVPKTAILANVEEFRRREGEVGYSTNGHKVLQDLTARKEVVDKVMMFTDCQMWDNEWGDTDAMQGAWAEYKKIAPDAKLYLFDLSGYGDTPLSVKRDDVFLIAGWSDKVFGMLEAYEQGESAVAKIEAVEL